MRIAFWRAGLALAFGIGASPSFAAETITYTYDALGRVTMVVHNGTVNNNQQTVYTFDPADNRSNVKTTGAPH